uniref:Bulb-type lectin domain-containing protein n=1 Tax=Brassica oleracea var. oleracea TaxID=109376 RepID=A0A0D3BDE2_BRAOL
MREMGIVLFPSLLLLSTSLTKGYAAITRASPLSLGQTLSSPGGTYELGFFSPNNSQNQYLGIWFKKLTPRVIVWVANREKPVTNLVANLTISINGSLILLDSSQNVVWSTRTPSTSNKCHAKLLDTRVPNVLWQDLCELPCFSFMTLKLQTCLISGVDHLGSHYLRRRSSRLSLSPASIISSVIISGAAHIHRHHHHFNHLLFHSVIELSVFAICVKSQF